MFENTEHANCAASAVETENVADSVVKTAVPVKSKPKAITLDAAYSRGFTSKNTGGVCEKCGMKTMYKERTLCHKCYKESKALKAE